MASLTSISIQKKPWPFSSADWIRGFMQRLPFCHPRRLCMQLQGFPLHQAAQHVKCHMPYGARRFEPFATSRTCFNSGTLSLSLSLSNQPYFQPDRFASSKDRNSTPQAPSLPRRGGTARVGWPFGPNDCSDRSQKRCLGSGGGRRTQLYSFGVKRTALR